MLDWITVVEDFGLVSMQQRLVCATCLHIIRGKLKLEMVARCALCSLYF
jgi:hypothetical protein